MNTVRPTNRSSTKEKLSKKLIDFATIKWRNYLLPAWMFALPEGKSTVISPAATFKPVTAVNGTPWQSMTTPDQEIQIKSLVIDRTVFWQGLDEFDLLAQIAWFKLQGVSVFLCVGNNGANGFISCQDEENLEESVSRLSLFNPELDFEVLASTQQLRRDMVAVLTIERSQQLYACMHRYVRHLVAADGRRFYDQSAYSVFIPGVCYEIFHEDGLQRNQDVASSYPFNFRPLFPIQSSKELFQEINLYPYYVHQLLEEYEHLINEESVELIHRRLPELRSITMPLFYDKVGLVDVFIRYPYFTALRNKCTLNDVPLDKLATWPMQESSQVLWDLKAAFPELEQRLDELIDYKFDIKTLVQIFPHRANEIFTRTSENFNLKQLLVNIETCPDAADSIINKYWSVIEKEGKQDRVAFFGLLKYAHTAKESLLALLSEEDILKNLALYLECNPPDLKKWLSLDSGKKFLRSSRGAEFLGQNPNLLQTYLENFTGDMSTYFIESVKNKTIERALYEHFKPAIQYSAQVLWLLSCYPQYLNEILRDYGYLIAQSYYISIDSSLPLEVALILCERYPESAQFYISDSTGYPAEWYHPKILSFIEKQLKKNGTLVQWLKFYQIQESRHQEFVQMVFDQKLEIRKDSSGSRVVPLKVWNTVREFKLDPSSYSISDKELQSFLTHSEIANPKKQYSFADCTKLSIGKLEDDLEVDFSLFKHLRKLIIHSSSASRKKIERFFSEVQKHCPELSYIILPINLEGQTRHLPYKLFYTTPANLYTEESCLPTIEPSSSSSLFVANNGLDTNTETQAEKSSFNMQKAGEWLNARGRQPHRIRTGIIELSKDFQSVHYQSPMLSPCNMPPNITDDFIAECRQKQDGYYYHMVFNVPANEPVRLLSVDAAETLIALSASPNAPICLYRGSDDFYYVQAQTVGSIEYVLQAPTPQQTINREEITDNDPVKAILDGFLNSPKFQPQSQKKQLKQPTENFTQWFERLYHSPGGSCEERCYAVWYQIYKNPELTGRVRLVDIDNNHVRLEIKTLQGRWVQIDLGGMNTVLDFDNRQSYQASSIIEEQQAFKHRKKEPVASVSEIFARLNVSDTARQLKEMIKQQKSPQFITNFTEIFAKPSTPVLVISKSPQSTAAEFLRQAQAQGKPVFYLYSPKQVKVNEDQMHLETGTPEISRKDSLDLFIEQHQNNPDAMLLINWAAFTPQQRVCLNSVIDVEKILYGKAISFKVYSLCANMPDDSSFISRHKVIVEPALSPTYASSQPDSIIFYDLKGLANWEETLFGEVILDQNQMHWHKSSLVRVLEKNIKTTFILRNLPPEAMDSVEAMLIRAKAQGFFEYHHTKIYIPENIHFKLDRSGFDFRQFAPISCVKNVNAMQVPSHVESINTELFDYLLVDKSVTKDRCYQTLPGWFEKAQNTSLELFITSNLSNQQWYCLLHTAKEYQVKLTLYCAPEVKLPSALALTSLQTFAPMEIDFLKSESLITVTNAPGECFEEDENTYAFAIEDYTYQDLMTWIDYQYKNKQFTDFTEKTSDVLKALQAGKKVVLYGEFSTQMIHALQPLILAQCPGRKKPWPGTLVLFVDEKNSPGLAFLPDFLCKKVFIDNPSLRLESKNIYQEKVDKCIDLTNSAQKSEHFIQQRLSALREGVNHHPILHMEGHTGVGKTFLMHELQEKYEEEFEVFHEFAQFAEWANASSDKIKVLFLDEVNITNRHLTMLEPLKRGGNPRVLYQGRIYVLTDKHRIVCATNPKEYGGGRVAQKLFAQGGIAKMKLAEIPDYFIYERMLKPMYVRVQFYMSEAAFKQKCQQFLKEYRTMQKNNSLDVCVRDLQEKVLGWILQKVTSHADKTWFKNATVLLPPVETDIVITSSMKPLDKTFRQAIEVRKQRYLNHQKTVQGLNGCLIEGKPGTGKSELVRYQLNKTGYMRVNPSETAPFNTLSYVKIDAGLPDELKKTDIRKAFNQGQIVWLDEVNSILDQGFEQWINAFLSGYDPDTHEPAQKPGFMLIVTANSIGMEGRDLISPALRGRLTKLYMPEPNRKDLLEIISVKVPELDPLAQLQMAEDLYSLMREDTKLTLRELSPNIIKYAELYERSSSLLMAVSG